MNSPQTETQTTLLTSHKGVDLHAASALLVMKDRLEGGSRLVGLYRSELHAFWGAPSDWDTARLLATGRFFNPNKHHFGVFVGAAASGSWLAETMQHDLGPAWLGDVAETDLDSHRQAAKDLYEALLGGAVPSGCSAVDLVSYARGQEGPVLSGVLWRLVISGDAAEAATIGEKLAVARHRKEGLLVNPHMENWLAVGG